MNPDWGLLVGDAIHNARAALDHLAWQLVRLDSGSGAPTDRTQFPIRDSPFDKKGSWITPQIQPGIKDSKIVDALEPVQPYRGPDGGPAIYYRNHLWRLQRLDITDKHRLLLVVRVAVDPGKMWWGWHNDRPPGVSVNFHPLEEGSEVVRFLVDGSSRPQISIPTQPSRYRFVSEKSATSARSQSFASCRLLSDGSMTMSSTITSDPFSLDTPY